MVNNFYNNFKDTWYTWSQILDSWVDQVGNQVDKGENFNSCELLQIFLRLMATDC